MDIELKKPVTLSQEELDHRISNLTMYTADYVHRFVSDGDFDEKQVLNLATSFIEGYIKCMTSDVPLDAYQISRLMEGTWYKVKTYLEKKKVQPKWYAKYG